jgi:fucose permease
MKHTFFRAHVIVLVCAFASFIMLGLPDGMLGVAWPSISRDLGIPLGNMGLLLAGSTAGYVTTTALLGTLLRRFGYRVVFLAAAASMTAGGVAIASAPSAAWLVSAMAVIGVGGGLLDGGLNAYGAAWFGPRNLNWLHACYGIGATIGPLVMTPIVVSRYSWRWGYGVYTLYATAILILFIVFRRSWHRSSTTTGMTSREDATERQPVSPQVHPAPSGRRLSAMVAGSILLFFLYTGLELVAGQWAFSLLTIGRGMNPAAAGLAVTFYWGALTAGRILFGFVSSFAPKPVSVLRVCWTTAFLAIILMQITAPPAVGTIGRTLLGFSLAPMFPLLIGETPVRVGSRHSDHVIGFQVAAAGLGAVAMITLIGIGVEMRSLEVVPRALLAVIILFGLLQEVLIRIASR